MASSRAVNTWTMIMKGEYREAGKIIKQQLEKKSNSTFESLHALLMCRLGDIDGASEAARKVAATGPTDTLNMDILLQVFFECGDAAGLKSYVDALTKSNADIKHSEKRILLAFAACKSWQDLQQWATRAKMSAAKAKQNSSVKKYTNWVNVLTAIGAEAKGGKVLDLAKRMLAKSLETDPTYELVVFYTDFLRRIGHSDQILQVVGDPKIETLFTQPSEIELFRAKLHSEQGQHADAIGLLKQVLSDRDGDDWASVELLIQETIKFCEPSGATATGTAISELAEFLDGVHNGELRKGRERSRAALLGGVCCCIEMSKLDPSESQNQAVIDSFTRYVEFAQYMALCATDARMIIDKLSDQQRTSLLEFIHAKCTPLSPPKSTKQYHSLTTFLRTRAYLEQACGRKLSVHELQSRISSCANLYVNGYNLSPNRESTEKSCADDIGCLGIEYCEQMFNQTGVVDHLCAGYTLGDAILQDSPHNAEAKLLMMRLCKLMGFYGAYKSLYGELDVKSMLRDTLSWLILEESQHLSRMTSIKENCMEILHLSADARQQASKFALESLDEGNLSKFPEIIKFGDMLCHSLQHAQALVLGMWTNLCDRMSSNDFTQELATQSSKVHGILSGTLFSSVSSAALGKNEELFFDNRDFGVLRHWVHPTKDTSDRTRLDCNVLLVLDCLPAALAQMHVSAEVSAPLLDAWRARVAAGITACQTLGEASYMCRKPVWQCIECILNICTQWVCDKCDGNLGQPASVENTKSKVSLAVTALEALAKLEFKAENYELHFVHQIIIPGVSGLYLLGNQFKIKAVQSNKKKTQTVVQRPGLPCVAQFKPLVRACTQCSQKIVSSFKSTHASLSSQVSPQLITELGRGQDCNSVAARIRTGIDTTVNSVIDTCKTRLDTLAKVSSS